MSNFRLFGLKKAGDVAISSIEQNVLLSHHVWRFALCDSGKSRYESTTFINYQRLPTAIAMKVSQCLMFPVAALPSGHMPGQGESEKEATRAPQRLVIRVGGDGRFAIRLGT